MDEFEAEYNNYWETKRFYEEIDSWGIDEVLSSYYDSSSPDCPVSSNSSSSVKNVVMERNRRRKLNESLYGLRSVVPNITKMDKASIIKDAIDYIQVLQEEERRMMAEVAELELELAKEEKSSVSEITEDDHLVLNKRSKKRGRSSLMASGSPSKPSIEVMELRVCEVGEKTLVISITCNKRRHSLIKLCEIFESLNLKILSANITSVCGSILHTLFVEADEMNDIQLKQKIEAAIAEYDVVTSPTSSMSFFIEE